LQEATAAPARRPVGGGHLLRPHRHRRADERRRLARRLRPRHGRLRARAAHGSAGCGPGRRERRPGQNATSRARSPRGPRGRLLVGGRGVHPARATRGTRARGCRTQQGHRHASSGGEPVDEPPTPRSAAASASTAIEPREHPSPRRPRQVARNDASMSCLPSGFPCSQVSPACRPPDPIAERWPSARRRTSSARWARSTCGWTTRCSSTTRKTSPVTEVVHLGSVHGTLGALARKRGSIVQAGSALAPRGLPPQSSCCGPSLRSGSSPSPSGWSGWTASASSRSRGAALWPVQSRGALAGRAATALLAAAVSGRARG